MKTKREVDEVLEYINESDTAMNVIFKAGFLACIKAVEDQKHTDLAIDLKSILLKL